LGAYREGLDGGVLFKKEVLEQNKNILYRSYVDWAVSSLPNIDSLVVQDLYNKGTYNGDYIKPKQAVFTEIRSESEQIIQKVYSDYLAGLSFDDLVLAYDGGVKQPVYLGSGGLLGETLFTLSPGEVSSPISNLDRSYSLVRLESFIDSIPFELKHVYSQIEQKLKKELKDSIKNNLSLGLDEKFNLVFFKEALSF
jgi:hypothetical protein